MLITNSGGGQSSELGDRGSCGSHALYATFLHEFGHQLGLDHTGRWAPSWCPIYPSLMNYAYSYQLGGKPDAVGYSDGRLSSLTLDEAASLGDAPSADGQNRVSRRAAVPLPDETDRRWQANPDRLELERRLRGEERRGGHQLRLLDLGRLPKRDRDGLHRARAGSRRQVARRGFRPASRRNPEATERLPDGKALTWPRVSGSLDASRLGRHQSKRRRQEVERGHRARAGRRDRRPVSGKPRRSALGRLPHRKRGRGSRRGRPQDRRPADRRVELARGAANTGELRRQARPSPLARRQDAGRATTARGEERKSNFRRGASAEPYLTDAARRRRGRARDAVARVLRRRQDGQARQCRTGRLASARARRHAYAGRAGVGRSARLGAARRRLPAGQRAEGPGRAALLPRGGDVQRGLAVGMPLRLDPNRGSNRKRRLAHPNATTTNGPRAARRRARA